MSIDFSVVEQGIRDWFKATFPQFAVFNGAVTRPEQVKYVNGELVPYIGLRFSDPTSDPLARSMGGARLDSYYQFLDVYLVSGDPDVTSQMHGKMFDAIIGHQFPQTGQLSKTGGGGAFELISSADKPVVFVRALGTRYTLNFTNQS